MALPFQSLSISALSAANYAYDIASGYAIRTLNNAIDEHFHGKKKVKFYYRHSNKTFLQVLVNSSIQRVSAELKNEVIKNVRDLYKKKKIQIFENNSFSARRTQLIEKGELQTDWSGYGEMNINDPNGNPHTIICRDYYGFKCSDGLMLKITSKTPITYKRYNYKTTINNTSSNTQMDGFEEFISYFLVWSDPTAMINFSSTKNTVVTQVVGRDYSRKELASNGDIKFSVSGHIFSGMAEVFPAEEVQKFLRMVQYKGLITVNNILLDQFNIEKILILDYNLTPIEGNKSQIDYSFNAIGIQPRKEVNVTEDTLYLDSVINQTTVAEENKWSKWLKAKAEGAIYSITDAADTALSSGINSIHV